jgi:SOS response regulatory protein OraA/RecX
MSRSGFYAAFKRPPSQRAQDDERLKVAIKAAHMQTRETYGPLRLQPELVSQGFDTAVIASFGCGASLACAANKSASSRPRQTRTTVFRWRRPVRPDVPKRSLGE